MNFFLKPSKMQLNKFGLLLTILLGFSTLLQAQRIKERVKDIKEADPFAISGNVGAGLGVSYNSNTPGRTPFSSNIYASLNLSFYSFQLPLSFYFTNNTTSFDYPQMPTFHLGFMPTWKNWKFHIGHSSMHFSNYTYSGLTFLGLGAEYQSKLFRWGGVSGHLQQATRLKGFDDRSAFQQLADSLLGLNVPEADMPQYRRDVVGFKVGVGNERNFIDLSALKAKDKIKSLPEEWRDSIAPQENLAIGLSGRFAIKKWFSFTTNLGASIYTSDARDTIATLVGENATVRAVTKFTDRIMPVCNNTTVRFAGDAAMNLNAGVFNANFTYRFIQPDYVSLGASNFNQNSQNLGTVLNMNMFKGRSNLSAVGYIQRDNLNRKQMFMNQVATYTLNWNNSIGDMFNMGLSYSGIKQDQYNGTCIVPDSLRIDQIAHTITASPSVTFTTNHTHSVNLNFNYVQNKNRNALSVNPSNVETITLGAGYGIDLDALRMNVNGGYDFSISTSEYANYHSHGLNAGISYRLMEKEKLNWSLSYNGSVAYNLQEDEGVKNNFSLSNSLGSNFSFKKAHSASMYLSLNNYSDREIIGQRVQTDLDCRFTLSYSYSFAARVVKKMSKQERADHRIARHNEKLQKKQIKENKNKYYDYE